MATHSSVLAWRIPWTEEPGGLQATGSQSRSRLSTCRQVSRPPLCSRAFRLHLEAAAAGASCRAADSAWGQGCLSVRARGLAGGGRLASGSDVRQPSGFGWFCHMFEVM